MFPFLESLVLCLFTIVLYVQLLTCEVWQIFHVFASWSIISFFVFLIKSILL